MEKRWNAQHGPIEKVDIPVENFFCYNVHTHRI